MKLIYFDEVKPKKEDSGYFWLGGLSIDARKAKAISEEISEISKEHFGIPNIGRETEFHAAEIYHRKGIFKPWNDIAKRIELLAKLLKVLDDEEIHKIYVRIDIEKFRKKGHLGPVDEIAFMFFCERANALMRSEKEFGMLIGDRESDKVAHQYSSNLSNWQNNQTEYQFGSKITNLVDTVHFTQSHLSRLLQLADIFIWSKQFFFSQTEPVKFPNSLMLETIKASRDALAPKKYKIYP